MLGEHQGGDRDSEQWREDAGRKGKEKLKAWYLAPGNVWVF